MVRILCVLLVVLLLYMTIWFAVAVRLRRFDVVDSAWGLGFVLVAWGSLLLTGNWSLAALFSACLVTLWGLRLGIHIARRTLAHPQEDHRYSALREAWGKHPNRSAYVRIFLLQGILILLVGSPMIAIATHPNPITALTLIGWTLWLAGIIVETVADYQLGHYLASRTPGGPQIMERGLWRYSRHPNYFGELTAWWGAALVAISLGGWWGSMGAVCITYLIVFVSGLPPLEKHYRDNQAYQHYARRTSILFPLPPKRST